MFSNAKLSVITAFLAYSSLATAAPQGKDMATEAGLVTKLQQAERYTLLSSSYPRWY